MFVPEAIAQSASVGVIVSCKRHQKIVFNAVILDAPRKKHLPASYQVTTRGDNYIGGTFDWRSLGMVQTGDGVGSTNSVMLPAGNINEVEVRVRIGSTEGSSTVRC